jgi:hypothetical protein
VRSVVKWHKRKQRLCNCSNLKIPHCDFNKKISFSRYVILCDIKNITRRVAGIEVGRDSFRRIVSKYLHDSLHPIIHPSDLVDFSNHFFNKIGRKYFKSDVCRFCLVLEMICWCPQQMYPRRRNMTNLKEKFSTVSIRSSSTHQFLCLDLSFSQRWP